MDVNPASSPRAEIVQWLLDTRVLWLTPPGMNRQEEVQMLNIVASRALALLSETERASVMRFYHLQDAKMSIASHLLKRLVISKYLHVPWDKVEISRGEHGKPYYRPLNSSTTHVSFNVSHQAGIVTLIAAITDCRINVGTDVVCVSERREPDYAYIEKEGFYHWVNMHSYVFHSSEVTNLQRGSVDLGETGINMEGVELLTDGEQILEECQERNQLLFLPALKAGNLTQVMVDSSAVIDYKIRRFYATWCMRETFVKMTGDALLAPWLTDFAIGNVTAPKAKPGATQLEEGEQIFTSGANIHFPHDLKAQWKSANRDISHVKLQLTALGTDFMVAGAIEVPSALQRSNLRLGSWKKLDFIEDILKVAELGQ
ncbi:hypothetical protein K3495_g2133 [Podosphaera aphanis]|nr:hypothetical protein K3495_g2133 [Podosphaera aphanis]